MTARLDEIRRRLADATPGPERALVDWMKKGWRWWKTSSTGRWPERCQVENWSGHCIAYVQDAGLAEFVARAPADIAWLLGEVERLTAEVAEMRKSRDRYAQCALEAHTVLVLAKAEEKKP